jgi:signal transduction histidine kinase
VKVSHVIEQAVQGLAERIKQNDLVLDIDIEPGIDDFAADGKRVTQMLYNLLSNAIGFSSAGGKIGLRCERRDAMIAFTVADQGVGIPDDYQQAVFDRFESRSQARTTAARGSSSVVKSLAELHGGTVTLDSAGTRAQ